jgi:hypothetical protein
MNQEARRIAAKIRQSAGADKQAQNDRATPRATNPKQRSSQA